MTAEMSGKRSRLVQTAAKLVYEQGFRKTTLADIAAEAGVPAGNVYYYFKTKDEIGMAVLEQRLAEFHAVCQICDQSGSPRDRLQTFIQMTFDSREQVALGGCPIGALCAELQKEGGSLAEQARPLFAALLTWTQTQFRALDRGKESEVLALHLVSAVQGISLLANTFRDPKLIALEADHLKTWIRTL
jgi:TetR/AcrR family transcriptional regulator, transcriptional repressor for nem operon